MKKFKDFQVGDDAEFYALVESFQKRYTPNKSSYYSVTLSDGDQDVDCRVWDTGLIEKNDVKCGSVYFFTSHVNSYAGKTQYVISGIRAVEQSEIDVHQFYRSAPLTEIELRDHIKRYIKKIQNPILKSLVIHSIDPVSEKYFSYPAAMSMHHNYQCGLAYHTYSMLRLADSCIEIYPGINPDLLYAGVLLHDLGKTKELSGPQSPVYTKEGNLLGHIVIGLQMVAVTAKELGIEDTEEVGSIEHLIASHHGELEYGSPKEPDTIEAFALHLIDLMDSKLASLSPEVLKTTPGCFSAPIASLNRKSLYVVSIKKGMLSTPTQKEAPTQENSIKDEPEKESEEKDEEETEK
jgi:3'-5' exoribonuclease